MRKGYWNVAIHETRYVTHATDKKIRALDEKIREWTDLVTTSFDIR